NDCPELHLCKNCNHGHNFYCRFCNKCHTICNKYVPVKCNRLNKPPYVCNGCKDYRNCRLEKSVYDAKYAQKEYTSVLVESRSGINADESDISRLGNIINDLISQGQSLHHICANHSDELMISERTLYRYIDMGLFKSRNIDLPRKVRYRLRKSKITFKVDKSCRINRTYEDFKNFVQDNPDLPIVEMDTVEGTKGGKVLLTIHFVQSEFMIAFLRDSNTSKSVTDVFNELYSKLGDELFKKLFTVILTDNGSEFSNPKAIETTDDGNIRSKIFYCNPSSPYQKGSIENNHELIRRILPKGTSFDNLTQEDVNLMMSHINSYKRKKLNDKSPIESFSFYYGSATAKKLNIEWIDSDNIILNPSILK
ncbi:MAG: IS30 family transposase, partial [bacterium]|nr:IS30 family transposase [bacterium]